ncbi:MAG: glycosyltransferase family 4 protein [Cyanobacteria bacterium P01_H01_bin.119]
MSKSPLKVSVIAPDLAGGGTTRVYLLSTVLQQLGHSVEVVGCQFGQQLYPDPPENLTVKVVKGHRLPGFVQSAWRVMHQLKGDVIYAVKPRLTSLGIGYLKQRLSGRPLLVDIDDWEMSWFGGDRYQYRPNFKELLRAALRPDDQLRNPEHPLYLQQTEGWVKQADAITVSTRFLQQRFGGVHLPNGKDTDCFNPDLFEPEASRQKYGLSGYRVLMFPGTARPHKGLEDVLIALEKLNQPDLRLVVVGGRKPDRYEDDLLTRWQPWLIKLPRFSMVEMAEVVSAAHAVVVPQRETATALAQFPLKMTDGMAMAKPILSTRVGDIPDILGDAGFLVEPNCPEQIAEALTALFADYNEAQRKGENARRRCLDSYSTRAMGKILSSILHQWQ